MSLSEADQRPKVGVGAFILNANDEFLMGRRKGSNGAGTYALPGGHLEFQESFEQCSSREVEEETGITIKPEDMYFLTCTNNILHQDGGKHYVTIFMVGRLPDGQEPQNLEPEKCEGWEWVSWEQFLDWIRQEKQEALTKADESAFHQTRRLFPPMITLVNTRPNVRPHQALQRHE